MTAQYIEDGLSLVYWFVKFSFCFQYLDLLYAPAENDRAGSGTAVTGAVFVSVLAAAETAAGRPSVPDGILLWSCCGFFAGPPEIPGGRASSGRAYSILSALLPAAGSFTCFVSGGEADAYPVGAHLLSGGSPAVPGLLRCVPETLTCVGGYA